MQSREEQKKTKDNVGFSQVKSAHFNAPQSTTDFALTMYDKATDNAALPDAPHIDPVSGVTVNPDGSVIERNHRGQVIRARYGNGNWAQFRFDEEGELYAFIYARLAWSKVDSSYWTAQDSFNNYEIIGKIVIDANGTMTITKKDVTRLIHLNGSKVDFLSNGTCLESYSLKPEAEPTDLLAEVKPLWKKRRHNWVEPIVVNGQENAPNSSLMKKIRNENDVLESDETDIDQDQEEQIVEQANLNSSENQPAQAMIAFGNDLFVKVSDSVWQLYFALLYKIGMLSYLKLASHLDKLADIHYRRRQMYKAAFIHRRALQIREQQLGLAHEDLAINFLGLANIYSHQGKLMQAEDSYLKALSLWDKQLKKSRFFQASGISCSKQVEKEEVNLLETTFGLVKIYREKGDIELSKQLFAQSMNIWENLKDKQRTKLESTIKEIGYAYNGAAQ